jgi:hypothetical protein
LNATARSDKASHQQLEATDYQQVTHDLLQVVKTNAHQPRRLEFDLRIDLSLTQRVVHQPEGIAQQPNPVSQLIVAALELGGPVLRLESQ